MSRASWYTPPTKNFSQLRNEMLQDPDLTYGAAGLLCKMMSFPPDWRFRQSHLETLSPEGRQALRTNLRELQAKGYIVRVQSRDLTGRVTGGDYLVSDTPRPTDGIPVAGEAAAGKAVAGKTGGGEAATTNTQFKNTDRKKIYSTNTDTEKVKSMSPAGDAGSGQVPDSRTEEGTVPPTGRATSVGGSLLATRDGSLESSAAPRQRTPPGGKPTSAEAQEVLDAYNHHRGSLPGAKTLSEPRERKIKALIKLFGADETIALMAVAASEVANDPFWIRKRFGLDNLLADQRLISKFEAAESRGTTDRSDDVAARYLAALQRSV